jgi:ABC-type transporter Mla subunit MlaD
MRISADRRANYRPSRPTILVTAGVTAVLMLGLVYVAAVAPRAVPLVPYYYVDAKFADAENLRPLDTVDIGGRDVGQVSAINYSHGVADVELQMLPGTQTLTSGATARIRVGNPIGAKYVEVTPSAVGSPLASHASIPLSQTSTAVDTQTLLSGFNAPTRVNLTRSLVGLGQGLIGRGTGINQELPVAGPELKNLEAVAKSVLAVHGAAANFAPDADSLAAAYDPVRVQLGQGFHPQAEVLGDFGVERQALQQTLNVAPATLAALQTGLAESDPLLEQTTGLARATVSLTAPAPAALAAATRLLRTAVPSLRRTLPLLHAVEGAVNPTLGLLARAYPILSPSLTTMQEQLGPLLDLAAHQCDFLAQGINWRSAMAWGVPGNYDPASNLTALEPGLGPDTNSFRVLALPEDSTETLDADAPGKFVHGNDAYSAPCQAETQVLK